MTAEALDEMHAEMTIEPPPQDRQMPAEPQDDTLPVVPSSSISPPQMSLKPSPCAKETLNSGTAYLTSSTVVQQPALKPVQLHVSGAGGGADARYTASRAAAASAAQVEAAV